MARRVLAALLIGTGLAVAQAPVAAQTAGAGVTVLPGTETARGFFAAPGHYGMSLGSPSYGSVRTYSEFSSPYGLGYGYGYAPYGLLPGPYGVRLWRPDIVADPLYNAGYHSYRTFAVPYVRGVPAVTPPVGLYAPAFGPPFIPGR